MERIFRKRTNSKADTAERPANTLKKSPSQSGLNDSSLNKKRLPVKDVLEGKGKGKERAMGISDKAPSLNVDIRNSLILPGLSQRFSVLLPSLSHAPESSIRNLLATQRARQDGPSLTVEEEELLFAEMRQNAQPLGWERDSSATNIATTERYNRSGGMSASTSTPSLSSSDIDHAPTSAPVGTSPSWPVSPPPTSNSFSSFRTFGVDESGVKTKSYGFSGNSSFRDADYIRKAKKSGLSRSQGDDGRNSDWSDTYTDYYSSTSPQLDSRPYSPSESDRTATPVSSALPTFPSSSAATRSPPQSPPPSSPLPPVPETTSTSSARPAKKRQSLLHSLSPAQVKRISMALGEIEGKLSRPPLSEEKVVEDDEEELLRPASSAVDVAKEAEADEPKVISHARKISDGQKIEPPSPSRLPPSPKSLNLHAHIARSTSPPIAQPAFRYTSDQYKPPVPRPIMTPSRTQPIRHNPSPSLSNDSAHTSPVPVYVPGQPRPVGSYHRSEGSTSSRSATPTHAHKLTASTSSHYSADQSPTPHHARATPLNRSQSVTTTESRARSPNPDVSKHLRAQSLDAMDPPRRLSSSLGMHPTSETIEEEDDNDVDSSRHSTLPEIKPVLGRHTVYDSQRPLSNPHEVSNGLLEVDSGEVKSRVVSQQGTIEESTESADLNHLLRSPTSTLRRLESSDTIASDYVDGSSEKWNTIFDPKIEDAHPVWPENENLAADMLRNLSGVVSHDLSTLQNRLVEKAKMEREQLRGSASDSPEMPISPHLTQIRHPSPFPSLASPPIRQVPSPSPPAPAPAFSPLQQPPNRKVSPGDRAAPIVAPRRSAPLPPPEPSTSVPLETPVDEIVTTPSTSILSRKPSRRVAPEDDPDVRRDFEARIAAATAALNRTPSVTASLSRKNTKRGAIKISSPTLVSSSAKLGGNTPVTPSESPIDPGVAKALEKASGSGSKMSMRWRKLGFKRGPSISNNPEIYSPPPSAMSAAQASRLEEPISLPGLNSPPEPPKSAPLILPSANKGKQDNTGSPDLNAFRFPHQEHGPTAVGRSQSTRAEPSGGIRQVMGKIRRGRSDETVPEEPPVSLVPATSVRNLHSPTSSSDSAIAKFVEAGRAVGLNDEQLHEMLVAKGMVKQPQGDHAAPPLAHVPPPVKPSQPSKPPVAQVTRAPSIEKKSTGAKGIFRSLSRKKSRPSLPDSAEKPGAPASADPVPRNTIVRRTLVMPSDLPHAGYLNPLDSPSSSQGRPSPNQRKLSIKRKPLNLTREDHALVHGSPPAHQRKVSIATTSSAVSDRAGNAGLGFLHPGSNPGRSNSSITPSEGETASMTRSSTGGSLYDLYGDDGNQETLMSPTATGTSPGIASTPAKRLTQAIEIKEYADGKMVWSVVDALRNDDDTDEIEFGTPGNLSYHPHSRTESHDSGRRSSDVDVFRAGPSTGLVGNTAGLKLRHRDRGPAAPRPPTNVYYTSANDVADLIDSLSSDPNASSRGRIDIHPSSGNHTSHSSPFPYSSTSHSPTLGTPSPAVTGQFEDAPSPQRHVPAPIMLPRPYAEGHPLPRRQLFASQQQIQRNIGSVGSIGQSEASPSAASFASSTSGVPGRTVEDRLQALLDRLKQSGVNPS